MYLECNLHTRLCCCSCLLQILLDLLSSTRFSYKEGSIHNSIQCANIFGDKDLLQNRLSCCHWKLLSVSRSHRCSYFVGSDKKDFVQFTVLLYQMKMLFIVHEEQTGYTLAVNIKDYNVQDKTIVSNPFIGILARRIVVSSFTQLYWVTRRCIQTFLTSHDSHSHARTTKSSNLVKVNKVKITFIVNVSSGETSNRHI